jgi:hypothetical protein
MESALSMAPRACDPLFLGRPPMPEVRMQLQALERVIDPARAEAMLREALELDPYCMDIYNAFCRLFIRRGRVQEAENAALATLSMAARAAGLNPDWRVQQGKIYLWKSPGPAERYYLVALETLAAVRRMQGRNEEHSAIMAKLAELGVVPERNRAINQQKAA